MKSFLLVSSESSYLGRVTAAGLFLFRRRANDYQYLLLKNVNKCDAYNWTPPQGRLVVGKNVLESAKIETEKLTGYTSFDYNVFEHHKHKLRYNDVGSRKEIMYYLTELSNNNKPPVLQTDRHSCFAWATFDDACRLMRFLEQKRMFRFFHDIIHDKRT